MWEMLEKTYLNIISNNSKEGRVAIVTGSLKQWKQAIIEILSTSQSFEVRKIFNICLDVFYKLGLREIWHEYRKRSLKDKTYLLERKR